MDKIISIIVPVYNVELYLEKCIESIVSQTYKNLEIILVDDGSTDTSGEICDAWAEKDERINVIHKKNAGLGFARNSGLDVVSGEYVLYIDSDDYIATNMVETLYQKLKETGSDTVFCGLTRVFTNGIEIKVPAAYNKSFVGEEIINDVLLEMVGSEPSANEDSSLYMSVWHAIYSMDIIRMHNVRFPSERQIMCEDIMYHIDYLRYARKVTYISDCLYYYRVNPKSLSQVYDATRFERHKVLFAAICEALSEFVPEKNYFIRAQRRLLAGARGQILAVVASNEHKKMSIVKSICTDKTIEQVLSVYPYMSNPIKHRIFNLGLKYKIYVLLYVLAYAINKSRA